MKIIQKISLFLIFSLTVYLSACTAANSSNDMQDIDLVDQSNVQEFIQYMADKHNFNVKKLNKLFSQTHLRPEVIASMQAPYEAKPWYIYKKHFISPERVSKGVEFWEDNKKMLDKATQIYGVPQKVIVAIIGVESFYGVTRGKYSVLDTLSTLAFEYPPRSAFFTKELEEFLLLCREQDWDALDVLGSYAGAVGQPQFMPSSYRAYAVDFDKNGKIDLFDSMSDIIGSVANYFSVHGWDDNQPIAVLAKVTGDEYQSLIPTGKIPKPDMTLKEFAKYGVQPDSKKAFSPKLKANLFQIETAPDQFEYWLGFNNFYVITRYNTSSLYALAVAQLAEMIDSEYKKT